jgi:hypothetical protein
VSGDVSGNTGVVFQKVVTSIHRSFRIERRTELVSYGRLNPSSVAVVGAGLTFKIDDCQGYASLQGAFDQYRIVGVEMMFKPINGIAPPGTGASGDAFLIAAVDLDSIVAPTVYGDLAQFDKKNRILVAPGQTGVLSFQPSPLGVVENSAGTTSIATVLSPSGWIDFAVIAKYYGLKTLLTQTTTTTTNRWEMWAEITYECRSQN